MPTLELLQTITVQKSNLTKVSTLIQAVTVKGSISVL